MMIPKERLIDLYVDKKLTSHEIAELLKIDRNVVLAWLKKYGMEINPSPRKYYHVNKIPLIREQKEFVVGSLLGNGKISSIGKSKSYRLIIENTDKDLILWEKEILGNFVNVINERIINNRKVYCFNTANHNEFKFFENLFYDNHKKIIKKEIEHYLSPLSLAVWYMDKGSLNQNINMRIASNMFSQKENVLLQEILKTNFDLRSKVCEYERNNIKYYYLSFNKRNSLILTSIIDPFVVESMSHKMLNRSSTTTRLTPPEKEGDDIV